MKKKSIFVLSACSFLLFGGLTSCDTLSKFEVIETQSEDYDIVGLDTSGYSTGDKVTFTVVVKTPGKIIDEVTAGSETVIHEAENTYSFTMPETEVIIEVTLADQVVETDDLALALEKASGGAAFETVFVEKQTYVNNSGEVSSRSRYSRKVTSLATSEYNLITRYSSVYDYNEDNFDNDTPIDVSESEAETIYMFSKIPGTTNLGTASLGLDNVVHYEEVLDSATEVNLDWYETFNNPFNLLTAADFTVDETDATVYHLDTTTIKNRIVCDALALIVFGDIQQAYTVSEFSVKVVDGEFESYSGRFADPSFEWYKSEVYFSGKFTGFGSEVFEAPTPVEGEGDATFDEAMAKLKEGNYTVSVKEVYTSSWDGSVTTYVTNGQSDGGETFLQEIYDENPNVATDEPLEAYYYVQQAVYDSWLEAYEYSVQQAVKIKDKFYTFSSDREDVKILDNMLPSFELSSAFFDKEGDTYTLKTSDELPYYTVFGSEDVFSPFTTLTVRNLKVTITDDSISFVTDDTYGTITTITYTDIGTTTVPEHTVNTSIEDLTKWEDYFKSDEIVAEATETIPSEVMNLVPVPRVSYGGNVANVTPSYMEVDSDSGYRTMQIICALDGYGGYVDLQYDDLLVLFTDGLVKAGFKYDTAQTDAYYFNKQMQVLGEDCDVTISLGGYSSYFVVEYEITPVKEETQP